ncbi:MAG: glycosyltransferase family 39 protein [Candidatus Omnitrophica bacterium]|nr:glycosyltransferase family 39 protein [Candidatus Omnitrophota bacterium]
MYRKNIIQTWIAVGILIVLVLPLCHGLIANHYLIKGHDAEAGLLRALYVNQFVGDGQILIRWASDMNWGYGSPVFNFYPPFFSVIAVVVSKITQNMIVAINLVCVAFWLFSAIGMYLFARELWGHRGGVLSAVAYVYAPYFIQDLYVRGAFAEFSIHAFFPWILLSLYKINHRVQKRYLILGAVGVFLSILTHFMSMFFVILLLFYIVFLFILSRNSKGLFLNCFIVGSGLIMASFFWLPATVESVYLNLNFLITKRYDVHNNFISLIQLFRFPWDRRTDMEGVCLQIGLIPILLIGGGFVGMFRIYKENRWLVLHYVFFLVIACGVFFLTLPFSQVIWDRVSFLKFIQFPWRLLTIGVFLVALLSGSIMVCVKNNYKSNFILVIAIAFIFLSSMRFFWVVNYQTLDEIAFQRNPLNYIFLGEGERTPKWVAIPPTVAPRYKFQILQGGGEILDYHRENAISHTVQLIAYSRLLVCFHSFYFPGWRAFVDGKEVAIDSSNIFGLIFFSVPQGKHLINVIFGSTWIRQIARVISWVGFGIFLVGIFLSQRIKYHEGTGHG